MMYCVVGRLVYRTYTYPHWHVCSILLFSPQYGNEQWTNNEHITANANAGQVRAVVTVAVVWWMKIINLGQLLQYQ